MNENEITVRVTLKLDEKWISNHSEEDIVEFLKHKLDYVIGFRGEVKRLSVVVTRK